MNALDERLIAAWQQASADLGFRLIAPFAATDRAGNEILVEGHLPDFGGAEGMLIVSFERRIKLDIFDRPMSILPKEGRKYVRKHVLNELRDWGWSGSAIEPVWLNGG